MWFFIVAMVVISPSWTLTLCEWLAEATVAVTLRLFNLLKTQHDLWIPWAGARCSRGTPPTQNEAR